MRRSAAMSRKIADLMETTPAHFEAPVLTRYQEGEKFALHGDASATRRREWADEGGQRVATCILYLNDVPKGGRTVFDRAGISVAPRQGDACVFFPSHSRVQGTGPAHDAYRTWPWTTSAWIVQVSITLAAGPPPPLGLPDDRRAIRRTERPTAVERTYGVVDVRLLLLAASRRSNDFAP